jgi:FkbM family methyltransferase
MLTALIIWLGRRRWLHELIGSLRVFPLAELYLRRFPLQRRLKGTNVVYRITSLDQLSIEIEVFTRESYAPALDHHAVETFIDLGCNAGWFSLWLSTKVTGHPNGLLVDAHPRMVAEAAWHLRRNGLVNCTVVHGAVGLSPGQESVDFHLHPSSSASSVLPFEPLAQIPVKGVITDVTVPAVSIAKEWQTKFGDSSVDLLKVDIEGKELDLVVYEREFLKQRVRRVIVEWHKWCISLPRLDAELTSIGFECDGIHNEGPLTGVAVYNNPRLVLA